MTRYRFLRSRMTSRIILASVLILLSISSIKAQGQSADPQPPEPRPDRPGGPQQYTLEQAMSEKAQLHTIAFNGVAFMTGTFGADTFLPPGKAADYFGFQYMRDIDAAEAGHNMNFLTYIANNVMDLLDDDQMQSLKDLAAEQVPQFRELAEMRLPMIYAFRLNMEDKQISETLSREAVVRHTGDIFELDGILSYRRAEVFGEIANSLSEEQQAILSELAFGDSSTWPAKTDILDKRSLPHQENILVMTFASEFFSWYAGSETADVYFCPERHGTYFGGFYMKDYPAMGNADYFIPTELTGESGASLLNSVLTRAQAEFLEEIPEIQNEWLEEVVSIRTEISREFRSILNGDTIDREKVLLLSRRYGELDGEMSYLYASRFSATYQELSGEQKVRLVLLRNQDVFPDGIYLYSTPASMPERLDATSFFGY